LSLLYILLITSAFFGVLVHEWGTKRKVFEWGWGWGYVLKKLYIDIYIVGGYDLEQQVPRVKESFHSVVLAKGRGRRA
jgi:hypothetical protein